ncbi:opacity protein-like surface antigen [Methylorubrum rhodinum]|uniref:Opacity protein-like surface antigen n=1 Tax=Methylorubrum rhodinum TaxID=29428 RepID=A0A840ZEX3_9HYPH|nr:outer membrane beta-barrel protein [Methylorubrum rhodinum]MBB5755483.1 opacity protein-like surface antigen [Methylorubrum rhodinum]
MRRRTTLLAWARSLTLLAGVGVPCLAQAADLLPPPPPPPLPPMIEPVDFAGGWYLRGDAGWGDLELRKTEAIDVSKHPTAYGYKAIQDKVGSQWFAGGGIGYQFNPWLRFDATGEYRFQTKWHLFAEDTTVPNTGGYNLTKGKFDSVVGLVNGYIELGTFFGVTPFFGAGVGFAHHMFGTVHDYGFGNYYGGYGTGPAKEKTNFAWAAHAGVAYALSHNVKLELAYRYLNMGDAQTGIVTCGASCLSTVYRAKEIDSHDVKVGLRYLLGGPAPLPPVDYAPPPGPLVRKY